MSNVINTILTVPTCLVVTDSSGREYVSGGADFWDYINSQLELNQRGFVWIDDERALPRGKGMGFYGGSRSFECDVALAAFNHVDIYDIIDKLKALNWNLYDKSEAVQLMYCLQDQDRFTMVTIAEGAR